MFKTFLNIILLNFEEVMYLNIYLVIFEIQTEVIFLFKYRTLYDIRQILPKLIAILTGFSKGKIRLLKR